MYTVRKFFPHIMLLIIVIASFSCVTVKETPPLTEPPQKEEAPPPSAATNKKPMSREEFLAKLTPLVAEYRFNDAFALFSKLPPELAADIDIETLKLSIHISANQLTEAKQLLTRLEAKKPNHIPILYAGVMLSQAQNNMDTRRSYITKILTKNPKDSWALTLQGFDYYNKKKYALAAKRFTTVLTTEPNNTQALAGLAQVYYMQNKLKDAEKVLQRAVKVEPNNSDIWAELALVKSETGRMSEALNDIHEAIRLDPHAVNHYMDLGTYCIATAKNDKAIAAFSKAIELSPDLYTAYIYRAGLNDQMGHSDKAIADYRMVTKLYPQYYFAFESLGCLLWIRHDWVGSQKAFAQALQYDPDNIFYAMMLSLAYYKGGEPLKGKKFMQQYIRKIDRTKHETEYFVARLFADLVGGSDVHSRVSKVKDKITRKRLMFYLGQFYDLLNKPTIAQAYYLEVQNAPTPSFFEYRLNEMEVEKHMKSTKN